MIKSTSLESLKSQIDIVDIVSNSIELKKAGANFKAPCPFHEEATASFVVSPQKQIAHCFGCGWGGDAIKFVQDYKKLDFSEAVEDIANEMNFSLEYEKSTNKKDYSKLMESINSYYLDNLTNLDQYYTEYLLGRGLTLESIKAWEIGYSGTSKHQIEHLQKELFNTSEAIECGVLAKDNESANVYARLSSRITFPVRNHAGKLIGFGGRITKGEGAKYINSPSTPLFDKSRTLYGYNLAKKAIHDKGTFTITEGYLDVIMFHQAGIHTAVATMGTALTEQHCQMIKKAQAQALLCYDGDKAGVGAALKAAKLLSANDVFGGVVLFPEGKDPADMVASGNIEELYALMKQKTRLIEFVILQTAGQYNLSVPSQKQEALTEVQTYLKTLSPLMQDEYRAYASKVLGVAFHHIGESTKEIAPPRNAQYGFVNISELSIIKTARESEHFLALVLDTVDRTAFVHHAQEFDRLLTNDSTLDGMLLREDIRVYTEQDLAKQLKALRIAQLEKQIQNIFTTQESFEKKAFELRKVKGEIFKLKKEMKR